MDEFANIALPNDYQRILATARSRNMSFVIVLQDKQQIEAIFEKHYKSILSNCNFRLFLGTNEIETCEYFSKFLGKETITVASETKNYGKGGGSSRNESKTGRELMTADELLKLSKRKCVIYIPGESACMDFKEDMTRHKYYRYIADGIRTWKNGYDWGEDNITHGKMQLLDNDYLGDIRSIEGSDSDGWKIIDPE